MTDARPRREVAFHALIPAAGLGRRMGSDRPKQYLELLDRTLLEHVLERFCLHPNIASVTVALSPEDAFGRALVARLSSQWPHAELEIAPGGEERCHSVRNGLAMLLGWADAKDWVLVHDAARPCLTHHDVDHLLATLADDPVGGLLATPVRDTLKRADPTGSGGPPAILETVPRVDLWQALTPQMFRIGTLARALDGALERGVLVTDEAQAVELLGLAPKLVAGRSDNIKVTLPEDLSRAALYLSAQKKELHVE